MIEDPLRTLEEYIKSGKLDKKPEIGLGFVGDTSPPKLLETAYFCDKWHRKIFFQPLSKESTSIDFRQVCYSCGKITSHTRIQCLKLE